MSKYVKCLVVYFRSIYFRTKLLLEWNAEYRQENISLENTSVQILSWPPSVSNQFWIGLSSKIDRTI